MLLRTRYDEALAQASYLVGCSATGEALVIDPNRHIDQYRQLVQRKGLRITAVTETHIHADFVSGARELARSTGAQLYLSDMGPAEWKYLYAAQAGAILLHDQDTFKVGNVLLQALHTPGHTPEHVSFLLTDTAAAKEPMGLFTGDFLFVGEVGRPDLLERAAGLTGTMQTGARQLFRSLQKLRHLPDYLQSGPVMVQAAPVGVHLVRSHNPHWAMNGDGTGPSPSWMRTHSSRKYWLDNQSLPSTLLR